GQVRPGSGQGQGRQTRAPGGAASLGQKGKAGAGHAQGRSVLPAYWSQCRAFQKHDYGDCQAELRRLIKSHQKSNEGKGGRPPMRPTTGGWGVASTPSPPS